MTKLAIEINNLHKVYKLKSGGAGKEALKSISLEIPQGSFFGLLGPNGAGKSTLINIIAGLVNKTSGAVTVNGFSLDENPIEVRRSIGVVPQEVIIDPFFNVRQILEYYAGFFGVPKKQRRTDEILTALSLTDKATTNPRRLSGGMKRRLLIAKALVHNPKIIMLDEPTAGVDVELRIELWEYVRKLNKLGTTVLLTTHYLEEAEQLCDRIAIINHGQVIADDNTKTLLKNMGSKTVLIHTNGVIPENFRISEFPNTVITDSKDCIKIIVSENVNLDNIFQQISSLQISIKDIQTEETKLEEVFRKMVNG